MRQAARMKLTFSRFLPFATFVVLAACDDDPVVNTEPDASADDGAVTDAPSGDAGDAGDSEIYPCNPTISTTLGSGAFIEVGDADCEFTVAEAAAGVSFPYTVRIEADIADVVSDGDEGGCRTGTSDGFPVWIKETVTGGDESYCVCDQGLCVPEEPAPATWAAGDYERTFEWDGVNWNGPSDTVTPKGEAFPPGDYTLTLRASGTAGEEAFVLETTMNVTITE